MKILLQEKSVWLSNQKFRLLLLLTVCLVILLVSKGVYAADLLQGSDSDMRDTMSGTGRNWLYWVDGGFSLFMFQKTKNVYVFFSILGVSLFLTFLLRQTGSGV